MVPLGSSSLVRAGQIEGPTGNPAPLPRGPCDCPTRPAPAATLIPQFLDVDTVGDGVDGGVTVAVAAVAVAVGASIWCLLETAKHGAEGLLEQPKVCSQFVF